MIARALGTHKVGRPAISGVARSLSAGEPAPRWKVPMGGNLFGRRRRQTCECAPPEDSGGTSPPV